MRISDLPTCLPAGARRVLLIGEAVSLSHVARPMVLAERLTELGYEPTVACDPRYNHLFDNMRTPRINISSMSPATFLKRIRRNKPLFDFDTLDRYVQDDLRLLRRVKPDVVIGDVRYSLGVSARLCNVPYATITNAYWSPYAQVKYEIPPQWWTRYTGVRAAQRLFDLACPFFLRQHAKPFNQLCRRHGLPVVCRDVRDLQTHADVTLYADLPQLAPTSGAPDTHHYIGPVTWSPHVALPDWWDRLPDRPIVYVSMGSTGDVRAVSTLLRGLAKLDVNVIISTSGRFAPPSASNVFAADYLPGAMTARRSAVMICNGGSPAAHQALGEGCPVIGAPTNMDHLLCMQGVVNAGAGALIRPERMTVESVVTTVAGLISNGSIRCAARTIAAATQPTEAQSLRRAG